MIFQVCRIIRPSLFEYQLNNYGIISRYLTFCYGFNIKGGWTILVVSSLLDYSMVLLNFTCRIPSPDQGESFLNILAQSVEKDLTKRKTDIMIL